MTIQKIYDESGVCDAMLCTYNTTCPKCYGELKYKDFITGVIVLQCNNCQYSIAEQIEIDRR